jgi:2-polyprenyl-3-methyl-5-hydroxy-6-metoxy-1,4-benzoquinol methylase
MGELFIKEQPDTKLSHSGERFTIGHSIETEIEHYHRYFVARSFCRGKDVLDIASGEGYGSAILAQVASSVVGVDICEEAVNHAQKAHTRLNLKYLVGDVRKIPIADHSVDVAVSFETLEHFYEHDLFMLEIKRVLRPDGCMIISTPDSDIYSAVGILPNPYHVNELTKVKFEVLCKKYFKYLNLFHQRTLVGSAFIGQSNIIMPVTFESRGEHYVEGSDGLSRAPFLVGIVSDVDNVSAPNSLFINQSIDGFLSSQSHHMRQILENNERQLQHLEHNSDSRDQQIQMLHQEMVNKDQVIVNKDREIDHKLQEINNKDREIELLQQSIQNKEHQIVLLLQDIKKLKTRFPKSIFTWFYAKLFD